MYINCNFCPLVFCTEYDYYIHVKTVHQHLQTWKINCEYCFTRFETLQELYHHYGNCLKNPYAYGIPSLASSSSDSYKQTFEREQLSRERENTPIQDCSATKQIHVFYCENCSLQCESLQEYREVHGNKCAQRKPINITHPSLDSPSSDSYKQKFERELSSTPIQQSSAIENNQVFSCEHGLTTCKSLEECIHNNKFSPIKPVNLTHPSLASPSSDDSYKQKFEREQLLSIPIQECSATENCQVFCENGLIKIKLLQEFREVQDNKCASIQPINIKLSSMISLSSDSYKHKKFEEREQLSGIPIQQCSDIEKSQTLPSLTSKDSYKHKKFERRQLSSTPIQQYSAIEESQVFVCKHCSTKCKSLQEFLKFHSVKCTQRNPINLTFSPPASPSSDFYKTEI